MTNISNEMIMAYVDGELGKDDIQTMENALLEDASLREKITRHHALMAEIDLAFNSIDNTPMPEDILALLQDDHSTAETAEVISIDTVQKRTENMQTNKSWWQPASIAASLAIAFAMGMEIEGPKKVSDDFISTNDQFTYLLNSAASGSTNNGIEFQQSFLKKDGSFCRTFQNRHSENYTDGLSCRKQNGNWSIVVLTPSIPTDVYLPASGDTENAIQLMTIRMKQLSSEEEKIYLSK
ncbi:MAG: hypothetical protein GY829_12095 [Gammaproteobacteria bacterium]|nr:hypothetical protein [Gammaproteobacteria bacterium]